MRWSLAGEELEGKGEFTCPINDTRRWSLFHNAPGMKSKVVFEKAAIRFGSARSAAKSCFDALNSSIVVFARKVRERKS